MVEQARDMLVDMSTGWKCVRPALSDNEMWHTFNFFATSSATDRDRWAYDVDANACLLR